MPDAVTILSVSDPQKHVDSPADAAAPTSVTVDWHLLHAGSPMVPGAWCILALPSSAGTDLGPNLESLGFSGVVRYPDGVWPPEMPCPGYVRPASAAGGTKVSPTLSPRPPMTAVRAMWSGGGVALGQVGLDVRAMVLQYAPHAVPVRGTAGSAVLLPNGLWMAPGPNGQVMGNSPSEVAAKLSA